MGLTIHYAIHSTTRSADRARRLVEQMRELARDLPFEQVGDIVTASGDECDFEKQRGQGEESRSWLLIQSGQYVDCPWNARLSRSVAAIRLFAFETIPGPGSEPANLGLCQYPATIDWEYRPEEDVRFEEEHTPRGSRYSERRFSWKKWNRWLRRRGFKENAHPQDAQFVERRPVKTGLAGWRWSSFCKTQYASNPQCGGVANFLRCHISVITLLERVGALPTMKVQINDEGQYGPARYCDDWEQAHAAGREPTYVPHAGKYSPRALAAEVGQWNDMIAAFAGALGDAAQTAGGKVQAPIQAFSNFEALEFRGSQDDNIQPFLKAMRELAERHPARDPATT